MNKHLILLLFITASVKAQSNHEINKPIFRLEAEQSTNSNRFLRYSLLTGYREGVTPTKGIGGNNKIIDKKTGTQRIYFYNLSLQDLISLGIYLPEQIILEVKNPSHYRYDPSQGNEQEWLRKNGYCFELMLPESVYGNLNKNIVDGLRDQIAAIIGVSWYKEKRMVEAREMDYLIIKEN